MNKKETQIETLYTCYKEANWILDEVVHQLIRISKKGAAGMITDFSDRLADEKQKEKEKEENEHKQTIHSKGTGDNNTEGESTLVS